MRYFKLNRFNTLLIMIISVMISQETLLAADCPCDIYEAAGTPCVAAYSTTRILVSKYTGPLYQVKRSSDKQTKDIFATSEGVANSADQETFLGSNAGTVSKLYDQSGKGNDLTVGKKGCYNCPNGNECKDDYEADAKGRSLMLNGHKVYAFFQRDQGGYRSNQEGYNGYPDKAKVANGMPTGSQPQGVYMVVDGKRYGGGCCYDFGNASLNNCNGGTGMMNTLFFGTAYWGKGAGNGPWFEADFEAGVWCGGSKIGDPGWGGLSDAHPVNNNCPSMTMDYAFGLLKTNATNYALRTADAQSGNLKTTYDGNLPNVLHWGMQGGIVLGIGGDNSNGTHGTFFEGAITAGRPSDAVDTAVLKNIQAAGYGRNVTAILPGAKIAAQKSQFTVRYNPSSASAVIDYTLQNTRHMTINVFNQQGKPVATLVNGVISAGMHKAVWDAKRAPAGVYVARLVTDGDFAWSGKIVIGK